MATPDATKNGPGGFRPIALPIKLHNPVVLEEQARRASDIQLRIADWITGFAGSLTYSSWPSSGGAGCNRSCGGSI